MQQPSTQKLKRSEYAYDLYNLYAGGLLVVILVLLQGVIGLQKFDDWLLVSMTASALAIPPLSGMLVVHLVERKFSPPLIRTASSKAVNALSSLGVLSALVAVFAAFGHVHWIIGIVFFITFLLTCILYGWYVLHLEKKP
jgi:hypothetical protein